MQFGFILPDSPGSIKSVTDIIRSYGARLVSILSTYAGAPEGCRFVYIRAFQIDREKMPELVRELKSAAKMIYLVDHRENRREVYS